MTEATIATIGHNSADVGEILESDPATIYREAGMVDLLIDSIKAEIEGLSVNLETTSGRDAIKSLAHSISKRKVKLENTGKALTEEHRKAVNEVNAIKKRIVDEMDDQACECAEDGDGHHRQDLEGVDRLGGHGLGA